MTLSGYNATRVLPERKRATRNGKRALDSFVKSIRDRTAIEHPEVLEGFDNDMSKRLLVLYFYFTKYIAARFEIDGMSVAAMCCDDKHAWYTDNLLDDNKAVNIVRAMYMDLLADRLEA